MCNLYSITMNQAAIAALFRVVNRYIGNLAPMPGVFPDYPARLSCATLTASASWRWRDGECHHRRARAVRQSPTSWRRWLKSENPCRHLTFCASELLAGAASSDWPLR
jgi:hypothetical protein